MKCPVCNGKGELDEPPTLPQKKDAVTVLREAHFSIREIQRLLGYKSPRSITKILDENKYKQDLIFKQK